MVPEDLRAVLLAEHVNAPTIIQSLLVVVHFVVRNRCPASDVRRTSPRPAPANGNCSVCEVMHIIVGDCGANCVADVDANCARELSGCFLDDCVVDGVVVICRGQWV
jgi:hypothetical protein